jgi:hypothetical protein
VQSPGCTGRWTRPPGSCCPLGTPCTPSRRPQHKSWRHTLDHAIAAIMVSRTFLFGTCDVSDRRTRANKAAAKARGDVARVAHARGSACRAAAVAGAAGAQRCRIAAVRAGIARCGACDHASRAVMSAFVLMDLGPMVRSPHRCMARRRDCRCRPRRQCRSARRPSRRGRSQGDTGTSTQPSRSCCPPGMGCRLVHLQCCRWQQYTLAGPRSVRVSAQLTRTSRRCGNVPVQTRVPPVPEER